MSATALAQRIRNGPNNMDTLREAQIRRDEAQVMLDIFELYPTTDTTRRAMQQHICGLQIKLNEAEASEKQAHNVSKNLGETEG